MGLNDASVLVLGQLKKGQAEQNTRLEKITELLELQNRWLAAVHEALTAKAPA